MKSYKEIHEKIYNHFDLEIQKKESEIYVQKLKLNEIQFKLKKLYKQKEKLELSKLQHILK